MIIAPATTSVSVDVRLVDDAGLPLTGKVAADFPTVYYSTGRNVAASAIALSDLALITTAYTSGGIKERAGAAGIYRLDVPNAALTVAGRVTIYGEVAGKHLICQPIQVVKPAVTIDALDVTGNIPADMQALLGDSSDAIHGLADLGEEYFSNNAIQATDANRNALATAASISNLNNLSALANLYGPTQLEVPASGSIAYKFTLAVRDTGGHLANLTGTPTLVITNAAGTDRSANASAVSHPSTGIYTFTYTVASTAAQEGITIEVDGTAAGDSTPRKAFASVAVVAVDVTSALTTIAADALAAKNNAATAAAAATTAATQATTAATQATTAATQATAGASNSASLPAMISANKFTAPALSNAPASGGTTTVTINVREGVVSA